MGAYILDTPWLQVLDNADNISILTEFWPTGNAGSILITSRDHNSATSRLAGKGEEPECLNEKDAIRLMLNLLWREKISDDERTELISIVGKVDFLPLALQSMTETILETKCSLHDFATQCIELLDIIEESDIRNINCLTSQYDHSLSTVWSSSLKALDQDQQSTRRFFEALCFLDPDGIQEKLMTASVGKRRRSTHSPIFLKITALFRSRGSLLTLALIGSDDKGQDTCYNIHRLIQTYVHSQITDETRQAAFETALDMVAHVWLVPPQHDRTRGTYWIAQEQYVPHVRSLRTAYEDSRDDTHETQPLIANTSFAKLMNGAA